MNITDKFPIQIYLNSIQIKDGNYFFMGVHAGRKALWAVWVNESESANSKFSGEFIDLNNEKSLQCCPMNHHNACVIRELFDFTRPRLIGLQNSIGLGDRLGIANPAHLRAVLDSDMKPILAQQSIRELERTQRTPDEVMDAATWAVFQEGYLGGFGADADHLKTTADIDLMVKAGFTMFTIDPGEYVINEADGLPISEIRDRAKILQWDVLQDTLPEFLKRYTDRSIVISDDLHLQPTEENILRGLLKYGRVISHTVKMYRYFKKSYPDYPAEFELSVDETKSVTTPFEHYLVANELKRLGVELISLAPRFIGDFEKGIDYKGDLQEFRNEYIKHVEIAEALGPYKISIHSGSDKFSVYEVIGSLKKGRVHVKTAGTSYLEALRTIAMKQPELFREILDFSREHFEREKATYHISARLDLVPASKSLEDNELMGLLDSDDSRQVLHVTFGKVLTVRNEEGSFIFKDRILDCLNKNETVQYENLIKHFHRHLKPFA